MGRANRGIPTVQEWLNELAPLADITQLARAQVEWIDPASGLSQLCSLQHALLLVVYREMQGQPFSGLIEQLGKTLTEEPDNFRAWIDRSQEQGSNDAEHQPAITAQAFLASLSDEDTSEAGDARTDEQERNENTPSLSARSAQHAADNRASTNDDAAELELLGFLRDHRPHLLQTYMCRSAIQTTPPSTTSLRVRPAAIDINPAPTKRNKDVFCATTDQERVHQVITSEIHKGKSGEAYKEYLTTSSLPLDFHPGMLSRLDDIGFSFKGISISHFGRIGYLKRLRKAAKGTGDMTDFTLPVPASPVLSSWAQLHAVTRGFL
ncbi:hypothetical protein PF011_g5174 [Phytophthora fragariae]|uniref:Uncharacterized protein n=1 Tax=Phytophthora fragariae TaxID=53985 RepID=A0A6A3LNI4_9STRA|nr:hypothetical protein PF011_g5174 [Phytophthora fragariae]